MRNLIQSIVLFTREHHKTVLVHDTYFFIDSKLGNGAELSRLCYEGEYIAYEKSNEVSEHMLNLAKEVTKSKYIDIVINF